MTSSRRNVAFFAALVSFTLIAKADHTIKVSTNGTKITFKEGSKKTKGSVLVGDEEDVTWTCDQMCDSIAIHFNPPSADDEADQNYPCQTQDIKSSGNPATAVCNVADMSDLQPYKYKITVQYRGKPFYKDPTLSWITRRELMGKGVGRSDLPCSHWAARVRCHGSVILRAIFRLTSLGPLTLVSPVQWGCPNATAC
jgi:hypothetical protein